MAAATKGSRKIRCRLGRLHDLCRIIGPKCSTHASGLEHNCAVAEGISSRVLLQEFAHLRKMFWGRHFWARGYMAVSSGTITDEMIAEYIAEQEGEPVHDDGQFPIDSQ